MAEGTRANIVISAEDRTARVLAGVRGSLGEIQDKATGLQGAFGKLAPILGSAFAGVTFTAFIKQTVSSLDRLNDLKDATGASVENLSALEDVALRTGTSFDGMATSLVKFNKVLTEAAPGSAAADTFKNLGLDVERLKQIDPAEALRQTAVAFTRFAEDGDKARIVQEFFGKSVREVAPFLKDLAEKGKLVATVTTQQAEDAEKFAHQLDAAAKSSLDLARNLTGPMLSALNETIARFQKGREAGEGFFETLRNQQLKLLGFAGTTDIERLAKYTAGIESLNEELANNEMSAARRVSLEKELLGLQTKQRQVQASLALDLGAGVAQDPRLARKPSLVAGTAEEKAKKEAQSEFDKLIARIRERTALEAAEEAQGKKLAESDRIGLELVVKIADAKNKLTDAEKRKATGELEGLLTLIRTNEAREAAIRLEQEVAKAREAASRLSDKLLQDLLHETQNRIGTNQQLRDYIEELGLSAEKIEVLRVARLSEALAIEEQALAQARNADASAVEIQTREQNIALLRQEIALRGTATDKALAQARDPKLGAQRAIEDYIRDAESVGTAVERLTTRTLGGLEDGLTAVFTGQKSGFKALVDQTFSEITRLYAVKPLLAGLFGGSNVAGSAGGDLFGKLFGLLGSGGSSSTGDFARLDRGQSSTGFVSFIASLFPGFATGIDFVPRDMPAIIHRGERVMTAQQNASSGGGATINNYITVQAQGGQIDRGSLDQLRTAVGQATQRALARNT